MKKFKVIGETCFSRYLVGQEFVVSTQSQIDMVEKLPELFEEVKEEFCTITYEYNSTKIESVWINSIGVRFSVGDFVYNNKVHGHITEFSFADDEIYAYITWSGIGFNIRNLINLGFKTYRVGDKIDQQRDYKIKSLLVSDIVRNGNKFYYVFDDKTILNIN